MSEPTEKSWALKEVSELEYDNPGKDGAWKKKAQLEYDGDMALPENLIKKYLILCTLLSLRRGNDHSKA